MSEHGPVQPPGFPSNSPFGAGGPSQIPPPAPGAYGQAIVPGADGQLPPHGTVAEPRSTNGFAVASLVMGIISFFACVVAIVIGIVGVVFGILGLRQVGAEPERFSSASAGMAIAGIVASVIGAVGWTAVSFLVWGMGNALG